MPAKAEWGVSTYPKLSVMKILHVPPELRSKRVKEEPRPFIQAGGKVIPTLQGQWGPPEVPDISPLPGSDGVPLLLLTKGGPSMPSEESGLSPPPGRSRPLSPIKGSSSKELLPLPSRQVSVEAYWEPERALSTHPLSCPGIMKSRLSPSSVSGGK